MFSEFTSGLRVPVSPPKHGVGTTRSDLNKQLKVYKDYYDGNQVLHLTPRQAEYLKLHGTAIKVSFNHCATVVDALVERLIVQGFIVSKKHSQKSATGDPDEAKALLWEWWDGSKMDEVQVDAHRAAVREGEAFVMATWDETYNRPRYIFHPRYYEEGGPGSGYGVWMVYPDDNKAMPPLYAAKQWTENKEDGSSLIRRTLYYPGRIEKYAWKGGKFVQNPDEGDKTWPIMRVLPDGKPVGIPFAHLKNPDSRSDLSDIISIQDAMNKVWLDILAASDSAGFRTIVTLGFRPTTDGKEPDALGSNLLKFTAGQMMSTSKPSNMADVREIDPGDLSQLLALEERLVLKIASISDVPTGRFQTAKQVAGSETLKQQEAPLLSKLKERKTCYGNAWEDLCRVALNLNTLYGGGEVVDFELSTQWSPDDVRNDKASIDAAVQKKALGIPMEFVLSELGYTPEQIETIKELEEYKARMANLVVLGSQTGNNPPLTTDQLIEKAKSSSKADGKVEEKKNERTRK